MNGLSRAAGNQLREYGLSGTEPVINQECMLVHERVDVCQFEWYRDNIDYITVSNREVWGVFLRVVEIAGIPDGFSGCVCTSRKINSGIVAGHPRLSDRRSRSARNPVVRSILQKRAFPRRCTASVDILS